MFTANERRKKGRELFDQYRLIKDEFEKTIICMLLKKLAQGYCFLKDEYDDPGYCLVTAEQLLQVKEADGLSAAYNDSRYDDTPATEREELYSEYATITLGEMVSRAVYTRQEKGVNIRYPDASSGRYVISFEACSGEEKEGFIHTLSSTLVISPLLTNDDNIFAMEWREIVSYVSTVFSEGEKILFELLKSTKIPFFNEVKETQCRIRVEFGNVSLYVYGGENPEACIHISIIEDNHSDILVYRETENAILTIRQNYTKELDTTDKIEAAIATLERNIRYIKKIA